MNDAYCVTINALECTAVNNQVFIDKRLSKDAFAMYMAIQHISYSGRTVTKKIITESFPWVTRHFYNKAMRELESLGYIERHETRDRFGFNGMSITPMLPDFKPQNEVKVTAREFFGLDKTPGQPACRNSASSPMHDENPRSTRMQIFSTEIKTPGQPACRNSASASYKLNQTQEEEYSQKNSRGCSMEEQTIPSIPSNSIGDCPSVGFGSVGGGSQGTDTGFRKSQEYTRQAFGYVCKHISHDEAEGIARRVVSVCSDRRHDADQIVQCTMLADMLFAPRSELHIQRPELWHRCMLSAINDLLARGGLDKNLGCYLLTDYREQLIAEAQAHFDSVVAEGEYVSRAPIPISPKDPRMAGRTC